MPATQYVVDWVNEQLPDLVKANSQSMVIETTIDPKLQAFAEHALRQRLGEQGTKLNVSQGALVVMDGTGAIKALVGGRSYKKSQFNIITQGKLVYDGLLAGITEQFGRSKLVKLHFEGTESPAGLERFGTITQKEGPVVDLRVERNQVEEIRKYKEGRDGGAVIRSLEAIRAAAKDGSNLMPPLLEGVKRGVTLGEVVETLKAEFGEWREPPIYW